jgi:hypothetical protein
VEVGTEDISKLIIRKENSHETSNNGIRVVNFATPRYLVVKSTMFPHPDIHKYIWISPEGKTENQTDHVLTQEMAFKYTQCPVSQRG